MHKRRRRPELLTNERSATLMLEVIRLEMREAMSRQNRLQRAESVFTKCGLRNLKVVSASCRCTWWKANVCRRVRLWREVFVLPRSNNRGTWALQM